MAGNHCRRTFSTSISNELNVSHDAWKRPKDYRGIRFHPGGPCAPLFNTSLRTFLVNWLPTFRPLFSSILEIDAKVSTTTFVLELSHKHNLCNFSLSFLRFYSFWIQRQKGRSTVATNCSITTGNDIGREGNWIFLR